MNDRRSSHHHHRQTFEEKYRTLENELKKKNQTIELLRNEFNDTSQQQQQHDLSRSSFEQSVSHSCSFSFILDQFSSYAMVLNVQVPIPIGML